MKSDEINVSKPLYLSLECISVEKERKPISLNDMGLKRTVMITWLKYIFKEEGNNQIYIHWQPLYAPTKEARRKAKEYLSKIGSNPEGHVYRCKVVARLMGNGYDGTYLDVDEIIRREI